MSRMFERFLWWHKLMGHDVRERYGMLVPSKCTSCHDCGWYWTQYYI